MNPRFAGWVPIALLLSACAAATDPEPEQCPTDNDVFGLECEPAVPACEPGLEPRSAESHQGSFGSLGDDGGCQSEWPDPYLAECTEPLPDGIPDLRGLWADDGHVERVEQCGNVVIMVGDTYTHGGYATGLAEDGVNDFAGDGTCSSPISVALVYEANELQFRLGGESPIVTRSLEVAADGEDELVWRFGLGLPEVARMRRHCALEDVPATAGTGLPDR